MIKTVILGGLALSLASVLFSRNGGGNEGSSSSGGPFGSIINHLSSLGRGSSSSTTSKRPSSRFGSASKPSSNSNCSEEEPQFRIILSTLKPNPSTSTTGKPDSVKPILNISDILTVTESDVEFITEYSAAPPINPVKSAPLISSAPLTLTSSTTTTLAPVSTTLKAISETEIDSEPDSRNREVPLNSSSLNIVEPLTITVKGIVSIEFANDTHTDVTKSRETSTYFPDKEGPVETQNPLGYLPPKVLLTTLNPLQYLHPVSNNFSKSSPTSENNYANLEYPARNQSAVEGGLKKNGRKNKNVFHAAFNLHGPLSSTLAYENVTGKFNIEEEPSSSGKTAPISSITFSKFEDSFTESVPQTVRPILESWTESQYLYDKNLAYSVKPENNDRRPSPNLHIQSATESQNFYDPNLPTNPTFISNTSTTSSKPFRSFETITESQGNYDLSGVRIESATEPQNFKDPNLDHPKLPTSDSDFNITSKYSFSSLETVTESQSFYDKNLAYPKRPFFVSEKKPDETIESSTVSIVNTESSFFVATPERLHQIITDPVFYAKPIQETATESLANVRDKIYEKDENIDSDFIISNGNNASKPSQYVAPPIAIPQNLSLSIDEERSSYREYNTTRVQIGVTPPTGYYLPPKVT